MKISNENISYDIIWDDLRKISGPALFIVALIHAGGLLYEKGEKDVFGPLGIGVNEFEALYNITRLESPTPTLLARGSIMPPARITRVLDRLESAGAIERHARKNDRRSHTLTITKKGEALFAEAIVRFKAAGAEMEKKTGSRDLEGVSRLITGIIRNLKGEPHEDTRHTR